MQSHGRNFGNRLPDEDIINIIIQHAQEGFVMKSMFPVTDGDPGIGEHGMRMFPAEIIIDDVFTT